MADSEPQVYETIDNIMFEKRRFYFTVKRTMDISLSLIGIILLLPIFLIISILVKWEDKNTSVIFKQIRIGKDGKSFEMYKFRSMVSNAEDLLDDLLTENEASGPLFKMKEDPRITSIGRFLRKTSLDELPQLFNVLKGEMSLVGPRPALQREVDTYNHFECQRLKVVPGLTCFWQVMGRSNLTFNQQVKLDIEYIKKQSLVLDIKLILKTFGVLFGSKDAY